LGVPQGTSSSTGHSVGNLGIASGPLASARSRAAAEGGVPGAQGVPSTTHGNRLEPEPDRPRAEPRRQTRRAPGHPEVLWMLKVAEGLRNHVKALLSANERSWRGGDAQAALWRRPRQGLAEYWQLAISAGSARFRADILNSFMSALADYERW